MQSSETLLHGVHKIISLVRLSFILVDLNNKKIFSSVTNLLFVGRSGIHRVNNIYLFLLVSWLIAEDMNCCGCSGDSWCGPVRVPGLQHGGHVLSAPSPQRRRRAPGAGWSCDECAPELEKWFFMLCWHLQESRIFLFAANIFPPYKVKIDEPSL